MEKKLLMVIVFICFSLPVMADNYNGDDLRKYAEEQEIKASALEQYVEQQNLEIETLNAKIVKLNADIDQQNTVVKRQRQVLDQWDSCELCVSLCKEKTKDLICTEK